MKALVEIHPQPVPELETSLIIGQNGSDAELIAAEAVVDKVVSEHETGTDVFSEEDILCIKGLRKALETGVYDTNGHGIQVIPPQASIPLLTAWERYAHMPERERSKMTDSELYRWNLAVEAFDNIDFVQLDPGVSPQQVVEQIVPTKTEGESVKARNTTDYENDFGWLHSPSDKKAGGNAPQVRYATRGEVQRDSKSDMEIFTEPPIEIVKVGVGVPELLQPEVPILAKDTHDVLEKSAAPQLTPEQRALSLEITQDGMPAVDHGKTLAKR
jgi:hypothetical protein